MPTSSKALTLCCSQRPNWFHHSNPLFKSLFKGPTHIERPLGHTEPKSMQVFCVIWPLGIFCSFICRNSCLRPLRPALGHHLQICFIFSTRNKAVSCILAQHCIWTGNFILIFCLGFDAIQYFLFPKAIESWFLCFCLLTYESLYQHFGITFLAVEKATTILIRLRSHQKMPFSNLYSSVVHYVVLIPSRLSQS